MLRFLTSLFLLLTAFLAQAQTTIPANYLPADFQVTSFGVKPDGKS